MLPKFEAIGASRGNQSGLSDLEVFQDAAAGVVKAEKAAKTAEGLRKKPGRHLRVVQPDQPPAKPDLDRQLSEDILSDGIEKTSPLERLSDLEGMEKEFKHHLANPEEVRQKKVDAYAGTFLNEMEMVAQKKLEGNPEAKIKPEAMWEKACDTIQVRLKDKIQELPISDWGKKHLMGQGFPKGVLMAVRPMDAKGRVMEYESFDGRKNIREGFAKLLDSPTARPPEIPPIMVAYEPTLHTLRQDIIFIQHELKKADPLSRLIPKLVEGSIADDKEIGKKLPGLSKTLIKQINEEAEVIRQEKKGLLRRPISNEEKAEKMEGMLGKYDEAYRLSLQAMVIRRTTRILSRMDELQADEQFSKVWTSFGKSQQNMQEATQQALNYMEERYKTRSYRP
ncbi:hypothetical protein FJZ48_03150 [Candidatus Uhrbacteria bacterium]|nr:hypothetical protein [Candidatus Uhrbacteria bacterium]